MVYPFIASFRHRFFFQFFENPKQSLSLCICLCMCVSVWVCECGCEWMRTCLLACMLQFSSCSHLNSHFCLLFLYNLQIHYIIIIVLNTCFIDILLLSTQIWMFFKKKTLVIFGFSWLFCHRFAFKLLVHVLVFVPFQRKYIFMCSFNKKEGT